MFPARFIPYTGPSYIDIIEKARTIAAIALGDFRNEPSLAQIEYYNAYRAKRYYEEVERPIPSRWPCHEIFIKRSTGALRENEEVRRKRYSAPSSKSSALPFEDASQWLPENYANHETRHQPCVELERNWYPDRARGCEWSRKKRTGCAMFATHSL